MYIKVIAHECRVNAHVKIVLCIVKNQSYRIILIEVYTIDVTFQQNYYSIARGHHY